MLSSVVFLDNQMPKMNGPEVATTLRRNGRWNFLVGLSGDSDVLDQERFRQAGVDEYVLPMDRIARVQLKILQIPIQTGSRVSNQESITNSPREKNKQKSSHRPWP
jgi:CheY-like chemotaxis protein